VQRSTKKIREAGACLSCATVGTLGAPQPRSGTSRAQQHHSRRASVAPNRAPLASAPTTLQPVRRVRWPLSHVSPQPTRLEALSQRLLKMLTRPKILMLWCPVMMLLTLAFGACAWLALHYGSARSLPQGRRPSPVATDDVPIGTQVQF
jgi:hypothetical protein